MLKGLVILKFCLREENIDCVGFICDVIYMLIMVYSLCKCFKIFLKYFGLYFKNVENLS